MCATSGFAHAALRSRSPADSVGQPVGAIALLGNCDSPVDALDDYVSAMVSALRAHDVTLRPYRVEWSRFRLAALVPLWSAARAWRGQLVLVQYTALQWSRRGFPVLLLAVLFVLRTRGARIGAVFHDPGPAPVRRETHMVKRLVDHVRRVVQVRVMRALEHQSMLSVFTIPTQRVLWLNEETPRQLFLPAGSNVPPCASSRTGSVPTVVVFAMSSGERMAGEVATVAAAARAAASAVGPIRLLVIGRNAASARRLFEVALNGSSVDLAVIGVVALTALSRALAEADVMLFVRGHVSSRRGSVIAGLAHGLPVVGYTGEETGPPMIDAGVVLVPEGDTGAFCDALTRVLSDGAFRQNLAARSRAAFSEHFSWDVIAGRLAERLRDAQ